MLPLLVFRGTAAPAVAPGSKFPVVFACSLCFITFRPRLQRQLLYIYASTPSVGLDSKPPTASQRGGIRSPFRFKIRARQTD